MTASIGHTSILLAFLLALSGIVIPIIGSRRDGARYPLEPGHRNGNAGRIDGLGHVECGLDVSGNHVFLGLVLRADLAGELAAYAVS